MKTGKPKSILTTLELFLDAFLANLMDHELACLKLSFLLNRTYVF